MSSTLDEGPLGNVRPDLTLEGEKQTDKSDTLGNLLGGNEIWKPY
jgi:hypothetical protein